MSEPTTTVGNLRALTYREVVELCMRLIAERDAAFQAGAEAMREAAAICAYDISCGSCRAYHENDEAIRALPLPVHQSSTQTGTKPTNG